MTSIWPRPWSKSGRSPAVRVGLGYDAHRLVAGRPLILGGVEIPYHLGLQGHSDADVLAHAIADALLGAVGAGDLGQHFPDRDPAYKGISSLILLNKIMTIVRERGYHLINVDATVVAQAPKLKPYISQMVATLAQTLRISPEAVNIKATTTEKMGFTGTGEGLAAYAVVLVDQAG
ncbi:MAG: 2-C-methyl-D-erythritol 2,4-cyclodiphosphate synthase [Desulfobacca sp. 4484_104]|nr:MAG: 2-C-methyl-D-erythritol 2,4-cyclodiphosphate synthase [Desulfobacca sp. 4484_104]RLA90034.1 MAG: 2-C-methyl-D-erythritol 2,4-cyclodiphosphate synthase [Deltaproteobacteria bacterium]